MKLRNVESMDPNLLFGLVNTKLRNEAIPLQELATQQDVCADAIKERLATIGFAYDVDANQFKKASLANS